MTAKSINEVLAANLAHFMKQRGIRSQPELAKLSGVSQRTISNYLNPDLREQGKSGKQPSAKLTEVQKIAHAMNLQAADLLRDLSPSERAMYAKIEAAYLELMAAQPEAAPLSGDRRGGQRRADGQAAPEMRRNQLLNPQRGGKDRRTA